MATFPGSASLPTEHQGQQSMPCSLISGWFNATNGLVLTTAAVYAIATAVGPDSSYTLSNTLPFAREQGRGTTVLIRMIWDNASTITTNFQYALRGRKKAAPGVTPDATAWQYLPNRASTPVTTCTITPDSTNDIKFTVGSTTLRGTGVNFTDNAHDCCGCDEFEIIPITPIVQSGGTASLFRAEAKII